MSQAARFLPSRERNRYAIREVRRQAARSLQLAREQDVLTIVNGIHVRSPKKKNLKPLARSGEVLSKISALFAEQDSQHDLPMSEVLSKGARHSLKHTRLLPSLHSSSTPLLHATPSHHHAFKHRRRSDPRHTTHSTATLQAASTPQDNTTLKATASPQPANHNQSPAGWHQVYRGGIKVHGHRVLAELRKLPTDREVVVSCMLTLVSAGTQVSQIRSFEQSDNILNISDSLGAVCQPALLRLLEDLVDPARLEQALPTAQTTTASEMPQTLSAEGVGGLPRQVVDMKWNQDISGVPCTVALKGKKQGVRLTVQAHSENPMNAKHQFDILAEDLNWIVDGDRSLDEMRNGPGLAKAISDMISCTRDGEQTRWWLVATRSWKGGICVRKTDEVPPCRWLCRVQRSLKLQPRSAQAQNGRMLRTLCQAVAASKSFQITVPCARDGNVQASLRAALISEL